MTLHQSTQKSKYFSKESDVLLLCITDQVGYGNWREIKQAIRRDSRAKFDHLFLSRSEFELARRVDTLVKALEKEELEKQAPKKPSFEEVAMQINQALDELRIADAKLLAEMEEQKQQRRVQARIAAAQTKRANIAAAKAAAEDLKDTSNNFKAEESKVGDGDDIEDDDEVITISDEEQNDAIKGMNEEDIHMIDVEAGIDKKSMDEGSAPVYNIDDDDEEDPKKRGLTSSSRVIELTEEEQRLKRL